MQHQGAHLGNLRAGGGGLQAEPAVQHQRIVLPALEKVIQAVLTILLVTVIHQSAQGTHAISHIGGLIVLIACQLRAGIHTGNQQVIQGQIAQGALASLQGVGAVRGLFQAQVLIQFLPVGSQGQAQLTLQLTTGLNHGARGHGLGLFQQFALAGQGQDARLVSRAQGRVLDQCMPGLHHGRQLCGRRCASRCRGQDQTGR